MTERTAQITAGKEYDTAQTRAIDAGTAIDRIDITDGLRPTALRAHTRAW